MLMRNPAAVNNTKDCLFASKVHQEDIILLDYAIALTQDATSQAGPLCSERKSQTMDRVLPQPLRTASDP